jgi:phosphotransferase system HPr-like phosphotransfer protein
METVQVRLNTIEKVKNFVSVLANYDGYFKLTSGKRAVDAKSIMGILTMNLTKSMELRIDDTKDDMDDLMSALRPFLAA